MKLTFNEILNPRGRIMLSSKSVVNTSALIKTRKSLLNMKKY